MSTDGMVPAGQSVLLWYRHASHAILVCRFLPRLGEDVRESPPAAGSDESFTNTHQAIVAKVTIYKSQEAHHRRTSSRGHIAKSVCKRVEGSRSLAVHDAQCAQCAQ